MTQKEKTKFRSSSKWKSFRQELKKEQKVDFITRRPLLKGFAVHHLDMRDQYYTDLTKKEKFICLNKKMHKDIVHELYRYYQKDPEILDRLKEVLDRMNDFNQNA